MAEKVRLVGDPVLSTPTTPVDVATLNAASIQPLLDSMIETMKAEGGIGLAANQIGHSLSIFVMRNDDATVSEYINPVITGAHQEITFDGEACLSIPGVATSTKRYNDLTLSWIDKNGASKSGTFRGLKAFAVQHEMDHLNGKLYLDQFGPVKRDLLLRKHRKFLKNSRR